MSTLEERVKALIAEFDKRWARHRKACLEDNDPQWRPIEAGQARAWDDARMLLQHALDDTDPADCENCG